MELLSLMGTTITGIAWPFVFVFLAIFFRKELRNLLRKASIKLSVGQTHFEISEQSNQATGASVEETIRSLSEQDISDLLPPELNENYPIIEIETNRIRDYLNNERQNNPNDNTPEKLINLLIVNSAKLDFRRWCERTIQIIYKEQVDLLSEIEAKGPFTLDEAQTFYDDVRLNNLTKYKEMAFETFVQYLVNENMLKSINGRYTLTPLGKSFLSWLREKIENQ